MRTLDPETIEDILLEWSYRLPNGIPTIGEGVIGTFEEVELLNQILQERGLDPIPNSNPPQPIEEAAVSLGSDPTDTKEGLVCLLVDAGLTDPQLFQSYRALLDKKLDPKTRAKGSKQLVDKLKWTYKRYGSHYKSPGLVNAASWIEHTLRDVSKKTVDLVTLNNAVAAADAICLRFGSLAKPGHVHRDSLFGSIRKKAVQLIDSNYQIKGYLPDNWCPGDIYLILNPSGVDASLKASSLNIGAKSLNAQFYGSDNKKAPIVALSLKMESAQGGKGTTFLKTVIVQGVSKEEMVGGAAETKSLILFRNVKRHLTKYYLQSDAWRKSDLILDKVRKSLIALKLPDAPTKPTEIAKLKVYLKNNKDAITQAITKIDRKLSGSLNVVSTFQQAYTNFINNLKSKNITKIKGNALDFIKSIEQANRQANGGKLNLVQYNEMLAQKAATYKLASSLMEKWTDKTKKVSPAFAEHLKKVKNPFVAITLYAIAQHGLNPNFFKVVGKDSGATGSLDEFPSNSQVDETMSADSLEIKDSPSRAGFNIEYMLNINSHVYKTTLSFRFASSTIRVEVNRLERVG